MAAITDTSSRCQYDPLPPPTGDSGVRVLVACEFSGRVRDAFRARGHEAWSCDILPTETDGPHLQCDVREVLKEGWDLMVAHPPCTYLSRAGARWWNDTHRMKLADIAAEFVFALRDAPIERIAIENPIGQLNYRWRYPDQTINPYDFGDPYSKATCLWLKGLPRLIPSHLGQGDWFSSERPAFVPFLPSNTGGAKRGQKHTKGAVSGGKDASRTFPGIAVAMAAQWGELEAERIAA